MDRMPRLVDINCTRLQFQPGDRILVKTNFMPSIEQEKKLRAQINKWAGVEVEVFVYCGLAMDIKVEQSNNGRTILPRLSSDDSKV